MDHLGEMFAERGATLHLLESLDCHYIHRHKVITHSILLRSSQQQRYDQVKVVVKNLRVELGQEVDGILCHLDILILFRLLNVVGMLCLLSTDFDQMEDLR